MVILILSIVVFLGLSGLMAAIDAAVLSVTRPEVDELILQRKWGARRLRRVKEQITQSVVVIVILTNTINVLGPILVSQCAVAKLRVSRCSSLPEFCCIDRVRMDWRF